MSYLSLAVRAKVTYNTPEMTAKKTKHPHSKDSSKNIDQLQHELELSEESRTRLAADYANLERRIKEERETIRRTASAALLEKLFPIFDNFYRASTHAPTVTLEDLPTLSEDDYKKLFNYFSGLKMVEKQIEEALAEAGLKRIATKGAQFDPNMHEAISYENNPSVPADHVIDEVEAGWMLGDHILRPAKVRVSQG